MTLVLHIDYTHQIHVEWSDKTTANMIFLVDPLQLCDKIQKYLTDDIRNIAKSQQRFNAMILILHGIILTKLLAELQIESILSMLLNSEAAITPEQQATLVKQKIAFDAKELERHRISNTTSSYQEKHFDGRVIYQSSTLAALVIFALWLMEMHHQSTFVPLVEMKKKYDVRVGANPPKVLFECDAIVPGLLHWIRVIYA